MTTKLSFKLYYTILALQIMDTASLILPFLSSRIVELNPLPLWLLVPLKVIFFYIYLFFAFKIPYQAVHRYLYFLSAWAVCQNLLVIILCLVA